MSEAVQSKSWKVEVQADSTKQWSGNALRFGSKEEAETYGKDLYTRWTAVRAWRAVSSQDPVMNRMEAGEVVFLHGSDDTKESTQ